GRPVSVVQMPAARGIGHQFAYLPDVARTMVALLARRETLAAFATFHMAGHWDADGSQIGSAVQRVVVRRGGRSPQLKAFPWWLVRVVSPFGATFRELLERPSLGQQTVRRDTRPLVEALGHEPQTPLDEAIDATLAGLGCFDSATSAALGAAGA